MPYSTAERLSLAMIFQWKFETSLAVIRLCQVTSEYLDKHNARGTRRSRENLLLYIHASQLYVCAWSYQCGLIIACQAVYFATTTLNILRGANLLNSPICSYISQLYHQPLTMPSQKHVVRNKSIYTVHAVLLFLLIINRPYVHSSRVVFCITTAKCVYTIEETKT